MNQSFAAFSGIAMSPVIPVKYIPYFQCFKFPLSQIDIADHFAGIFQYCREYLLVLLLFTPASILQVLFQNLFVTAGRPGVGMALSVGAGVANVLLDYLFMVPLHMGIRGSALGTGIGYLIPAPAGILFFAGNRGSLKFRRPQMDFAVLRESCFNDFSEMVSQTATAGG